MERMDEKKKELLRKLQALAQRGVGGEKESAQKKLEELMEKYGVEEADLTDEAEEDNDFFYKNEFEKKILIQLFYKIVPDYERKTYTYRYGRGSRRTYGITCTAAQALQIKIEYEFYKTLWEEEVNFFMKAFIQKHRIFDCAAKPVNQDPMDKEKLKRMASMMQGMQDRKINPMIEEKKEGDE